MPSGTKLKLSPRGLSSTRSIQKATLATNSTQQLKRTNAKATTIASAVGSASLTSLAHHHSPNSANRATNVAALAASIYPAGASASSSATADLSSPSSSLDPLAVLKCDAGHARAVTHLHLARRGLSSLHPNLLLFVNLEELWLNNNNLAELAGIAPSPEKHHLAVPSGCLRLRRLFLSHNRLSTFAGSDLPRLPHLEVLLAAENRLTNLEAVSQQLACLVNLKQLDLAGNPIAEERNYREYIVAHHPSLEVLDRRTITDTERAQALTMFPPVQVSRAKGSSAALDRVAFGSCSASSERATNNNSSPNRSGVLPSSNANNISLQDVNSSGANFSPSSFNNNNNRDVAASKNRTQNNNNHGMSQMAEVLEIRAKNVRHKRRIEEESKKTQKEREFQACATLQENFHKAWNDAVVKHINHQHQQQVDAAIQQQQHALNEKGAKQQQQQRALAGQDGSFAIPPPPPPPTLVLPVLQRGVVPSLFDARRPSQAAPAGADPSQKSRSISFPRNSSSTDPLRALTMERDATIFAKCLSEATQDQERRKKYSDAEAACLTPSEVSAIVVTFPLTDARSTATSGSNPTYPVKDVSRKLVEILNLNDHLYNKGNSNNYSSGSSPPITIITEASLIAHLLNDKNTRHGRMEGGENVLRALVEFTDFTRLRTERLYKQSNDVVRTKPEEAVSLLRRISTLQDFEKYLGSTSKEIVKNKK